MRSSAWRSLALLAILLAAAAPSFAGGPRYVTGPPFFKTQGRAIGWKQSQLLYFTDPGDLSAALNHQAADQLVADAAAVWNVPLARLSLSAGGALAEHVNSGNVYLSTSGMEWPPDVLAANANAIPLAVVYDLDGSVTDTLLGAGASYPAGCLQNAVTESVDAFDPAGYILHAVIVLNGRCTGTAPELQLQMRYQLERAFGRVLGLAWSQTNDNVFTGSPTPTYDQALHWPVMHPIDIRCGLYTYQCMVQPFVLRPDDVQALVSVYPVTGTPAADKQVSLADGNTVVGTVTFPTGQGMAGVNVLVQRAIAFTSTPQDWYESSVVTGSYFRRNALSPFVSADPSALGSQGSSQTVSQGAYLLPYFQVQGYDKIDTVLVSTEPINPLYNGRYGLGSYTFGNIVPAGAAPAPYRQELVLAGSQVTANFNIANAPTVCGTGAAGTMTAPMVAPTSGWWNGILCPFGGVSIVQAAIKTGHSFALEVTALDANGLATTTKLMPVLGVFSPSDTAGSLPTLASQVSAFNSMSVGTTSLQAALSANGGVRIGIADQRSEGRPDFRYQARLFYADAVAPTSLPNAGADVTLTGMGFRLGNQVLVNGVVANVKSWTASTLVLTAPAMADAAAIAGTPVDVTVKDIGTGAVSNMTGALTYQVAGQQSNGMLLVGTPASPAIVGSFAAGSFSIRVVAGDGLSPVAGVAVVFSVAAGQASLGACAAAHCTVLTDATGLAQTTVKPLAAGLVSLQATNGALQQGISLTAQVQALQIKLVNAPAVAAIVGQISATPFSVQVLGAGGGAIANDLVTFSVASGAGVFSVCNASPCSMPTTGSGQAYMWITPQSAGSVTLVATEASGLSQQVTLQAVDVPMTLKLLTAATQTAYVGKFASTTVQAVQGDGVSAIRGQLVKLTGTDGLDLTCSYTTCQVYTDYFGNTGTGATAAKPGVYTLTATSGSASATVTYRFLEVPPSQLSLLSFPTGTLTLGAASTVPFSVRLVDGFSRPLVDNTVILSLPPRFGSFDCGQALCPYQTDWDGTVSSSFTPLVGGTLLLNAAVEGLAALTANVTVAGGVPMLNILQAPPATVTVGSQVTVATQMLAANGSPLPAQTMWVITTQGTLANPACVYSTCKYYTDTNGKVTVIGKAWTPGTISLQFNANGLQQNVSFNVVPATMNFKLISAPSGTVQVGTPAIPFAVELVGADGVTPVQGQNILFSFNNGTAGLAACSSTPCVVKTGSNGIASTGAIATTAAGNVNLLATLNGMTISASFNVAAKPDLLTLTSAPTTVLQTGTGVTPFAVKLTLADGVTPAAGVPVGLGQSGSGGVQFGLCNAASCTGATDATGLLASTVTGAATGAVTLTATAQLPTGNQVVSSQLQVTPSLASLRAVSAPVGSVNTGTPAAALVVQLLGPDGVTAAANQVLTFSLASGSAFFASCGASVCKVSTDANGMASSGTISTPVVGPVRVLVAWGSLSVSASFVVTARPDVLALVQAPLEGMQWQAAPAPLVVRVTVADGVTGVSGVPVSLAATSAGAVLFGWCGSAVCSGVTDADGTVSSTVVGLSAGAAILTATAQLPTGPQTVSAAYNVAAGRRSVLAQQPVLFLAEGETVATTLHLFAQQNGAPIVIPLAWSTTGPVALGETTGTTTATDSAGQGVQSATFSPLAAGSRALVQACGWGSVCAQFTATGVRARDWKIVLQGGGEQTVSGGATYSPIVLQITDSAGNPVAGAPVTIGQMVLAGDGSCPTQGRCPQSEVLSSSVTVVASDTSGHVTFQPITAASGPSQTAVQCTSGLFGAVSIVLRNSL